MSNQVTKKETMLANQKKVISLLTGMKDEMRKAMPAHMTPDRMARIALTQLRTIPKLQECNPMSFVAAVMLCSQLGLEIGSLGEAYLIPYGEECKFILGYKGMISLARRSGQIVSLAAHCVYAKDEFSYQYGLNDDLKHVPNMGADRGDFVCCYAVAKLTGGGYQFEVMGKADIENIRKRSKAGNSGPWQTDFDEMARKTAIRKLFKYLPASVEMQKAVSFEEQAESQGKSAIQILSDDNDVVADFFEGETTATATSTAVRTQAEELAEML